MKSVGKKCRVTSTPKGLNNQIKLWVSINKEHGIEFDERYLFWCSTPLGLVFYVVVVLLPTDFIGGYLCLTLRVFFPIIDYQCIKTCTERSRGKWNFSINHSFEFFRWDSLLFFRMCSFIYYAISNSHYINMIWMCDHFNFDDSLGNLNF